VFPAKKDGRSRGRQRYRCKACGHVWLGAKPARKSWVARAYEQYSSGRHTLDDLSQRYGRDVETLRRQFDRYTPPILTPAVATHPVALTFDATFFGRGYGLLIYRAEGRNIFWQEIVTERMKDIEDGLKHLLAQGWRFSSVTLDGRKGAIQLIERLQPCIPIQMCLFHQKAIIRRYTTGKPKTPCGKAIRNLMHDLLEISEVEFLRRLQELLDTYGSFLKERNDQNQFRHRRLRSALRSLRSNAPYLFAHQRFPESAIPTTTNSCDGSFAHWKAKIKIHRGLRHDRRSKMIAALLSKS